MATYGKIAIDEPTTTDKLAATVRVTRNSSVMEQEIVTLGDAESSLGIARVLDAVPTSTEFGLVVRVADPSTGPFAISTGSVRVIQSTAADLNVTVAGYVAPSTTVAVSTVGGKVAVVNSSAADLLVTATPAAGSTWSVRPLQSSAADLQVTATPVAGSTWATRPLQSSQGDLRMTAYQSSRAELLNTVYQSSAAELQMTATIGTNLQSTAGASSNSSGLIVRPVMDNLFSVASTSGFASTTLVISQNVANQRCKIYGYSITSTVEAVTSIRFMGGSTLMWTLVTRSLSSAITGANLMVDPPGYICAGDVNSSVSLRVDSTVAGFHVSVAYFMAP